MLIVSADKLAKVGYQYINYPYAVMDCQAFVEKCLADCGLKINLAGSNTWYRKMDWTGTPEECRKKFGHIPAGAFLFILESDGKEPAKYRADGIGNASHIGIYTAMRQGAIHSSASRGSVQESRFSGKTIKGGWNRIGLWQQISYDISINFMLAELKEEKAEGDKMEEVIIQGGNLDAPINMRTAASSGSGLIAQLKQGTTATLLEGGGAWNKIQVGKQTGYVKSEFVHKSGETAGEIIKVSKAELEKAYDILGGLLERRG